MHWVSLSTPLLAAGLKGCLRANKIITCRFVPLPSSRKSLRAPKTNTESDGVVYGDRLEKSRNRKEMRG